MADKKNRGKEEELKKVVPTFDPTRSKPVFSWQAPEFIKYNKDSRWYVILFVVALVLAIVLIWQKIWSGVAMVVVASVVFATLSEAKPKTVSCAVYKEGVVIDDKVFNFHQFKSFWFTGRDLLKMKFQMTGRFAGQVTMPIKDEDPEQLRLLVGKFLPEVEDRGDDLVDTINRLMKF